MFILFTTCNLNLQSNGSTSTKDSLVVRNLSMVLYSEEVDDKMVLVEPYADFMKVYVGVSAQTLLYPFKF